MHDNTFPAGSYIIVYPTADGSTHRVRLTDPADGFQLAQEYPGASVLQHPLGWDPDAVRAARGY